MVFAHGIGGAKDLPIPAEYAMAGAGAALAVSFIVLALAWRTPRFDAATQGPPRSPAWLASRRRRRRASRWLLRVLGLAFFAVRRVGGRRRAGPAAQPDVRRGLRAALGRPGAGVAAVRAVLPGGQPGAHDPPRCSRRLTGGDPDEGMLTLPGLGRATGRRRSACSPSSGSSWSTPARRTSRRCGCGSRPTSRS